MKRSTFIMLFVGTNILFIFLQIHKKGEINKLSYQLQKKEAELAALDQQVESLTHQLQALANPTNIKHAATTDLNMKPIKISQVHLLPEPARKHEQK